MAQQSAQKSISERGFASMDRERQREIASRGGRAAHLKGTAHEFDSREAAEAGRKGGQVVSQDRKHMAQIGAEGGRARSLNRLRNLGIAGQAAKVSEPPQKTPDEKDSQTPIVDEEPRLE